VPAANRSNSSLVLVQFLELSAGTERVVESFLRFDGPIFKMAVLWLLVRAAEATQGSKPTHVTSQPRISPDRGGNGKPQRYRSALAIPPSAWQRTSIPTISAVGTMRLRGGGTGFRNRTCRPSRWRAFNEICWSFAGGPALLRKVRKL